MSSDETRHTTSGPLGPDAPTEVVSPPPNDSSLDVGTVLFNTYVVDRHLSSGGMGDVYEAHSRVNGARYAIKVIRASRVHDERVRDLFIREGRVLQRVRSGAVVSYAGQLQDEHGRCYLIMDFIDGQSLANRLRREPLSASEASALLRHLGRGLAEVHAAGAFHRDLSPDNILLPDDDVNRAVIIDFGIAKLKDPDQRTLIGSDIAGKLGFMAPEQIGAIEAEVDARTDIYALGLVIAAAVCGRPIDMGHDLGAAMRARQSVPNLDGLPARLRPLIARMLSPDQAKRPPSMQAVVDALDALPRPSRTSPGPWRPEERGRLHIALPAILIVLALGGAGGVWLWSGMVSIKAPNAPETTPRPPVVATQDGHADGTAGDRPTITPGLGAPASNPFEDATAGRPDTPATSDVSSATVGGAEVDAADGSVADGNGEAHRPGSATAAGDPQLDDARSDRDPLPSSSAVRAALPQVPCGRVASAEVFDDGRVELAGTVARSADRRRLVERVREVPGVRGVDTTALLVEPDAVCLATAFMGQLGGAAALKVTTNREQYADGEFFVVKVDIADGQSGYLYLDFFSPGRPAEVQHLLPRSDASRNDVRGPAQVEVGCYPFFDPDCEAWVMGEPFGDAVVTAILSETPLRRSASPDDQLAIDYLDSLYEAALVGRASAVAVPLTISPAP